MLSALSSLTELTALGVNTRQLLFRYTTGDDTTAATYSRPSTATYENEAGQVLTAAANVLRGNHWTYDRDSGQRVPGRLLEPQRTNYVTSADFSDLAHWSAAGVVITSIGVDPYLGVTVCKMDSAVDAIFEPLTYFAVNEDNSNSRTFSVYLKAAEYSEAYVAFSTGGDHGVYVNLANQTLKVVGTVSAMIEKGPNGWCRVSISKHGSNGNPFIEMSDGGGSDGDARHAFPATEGWGIKIACPQLEEGPFATSYIPTSGSPVTRAADVLEFPWAAGNPGTPISVYVRQIKMWPDNNYAEFVRLNNEWDVMAWNSGTTLSRKLADPGAATPSIDIGHGDSLELLMTLDETNLAHTVSRDGNAETTVYAASNGLPSGTGTTLSIGSFNTQYHNAGTYRDVIVAKGVKPLAYFRSKVYRPTITPLFQYKPGDDIAALGGTFTRASTAYQRNQLGVWVQVASGALRDSHYEWSPVAGAYVQTTLLEGQRTNFCWWSSQFSNSPWLAGSQGIIPPPVLTPGFASPDGGSNATRISFPAMTDSGSYTVVTQSIHAGFGVPVTFSVWLRGETGTEIVWLNETPDGSAYIRKQCNLTTEWQRFTLTGSPDGYTYWQIGVDLRDGSEAARPAQTIYAWHAQVEPGSFASSPIPTAGSAVTRAADSLSFAFLHAPQVMSMYAQMIERGTILESNYGVMAFDNLIDTGNRLALHRTNSSKYRLINVRGADNALAFSDIDSTPALGDAVELCGVLVWNGSVRLSQRVNGSTVSNAAQSGALEIPSAWSDQKLWVGAIGNAQHGFNAFQRIVVARDEHDTSWFTRNFAN